MTPDNRGPGRPSGRPGLTFVALVLVATAACTKPAEHTVIPEPRIVELSRSDTFRVSDSTRITFDAGDAEAAQIGSVLAGLIGNTVESTPSVVPLDDSGRGDSVPSIYLSTRGRLATFGYEGYELDVDATRVKVTAATAAGLFYGVQTLRQLLPPLVEYTAAYRRPLFVPSGRIVDWPRFEWRGVMLDVARHFRPVADVERLIDLMALYKLNRLHLHLSDDQGWRIEIPGWPKLTEVGGRTQVGGRGGGFYTTADYEEIVRYAADRFVTVVPEIDMPGHTNAALASYAELNCDGVAPEPYTGTDVGFSSLCTSEDVVYDFLAEVISRISDLTPGPYFHVGGDEARRTTPEDYAAFIERVQAIVRSHGKRMIGWDETVTTNLAPESMAQLWRPLWPEEGEAEPDSATAAAVAVLQNGATRAAESGVKFILSPADRVYLDMKYDASTVLGLRWAGLSDPRQAYDWEPTAVFSRLPERSIAGVEATLWSETLGSMDDVEYLAFPRLAGVAELGWSPADVLGWEDFRRRVGAHGARWTALGVNFQRSAEIDWTLDPR